MKFYRLSESFDLKVTGTRLNLIDINQEKYDYNSIESLNLFKSFITETDKIYIPNLHQPKKSSKTNSLLTTAGYSIFGCSIVIDNKFKALLESVKIKNTKFFPCAYHTIDGKKME